MESIIKKMLEAWVSKEDCCKISSYNFIQQEDEYNWKVSVMETDKEDNVWLCMYNVWISDSEFRIVEI
jgi:hypothetical protein